MESREQFSYLYERYLANTATPQEVDQLFSLIADDNISDELRNLLGDTWDQLNVAPGSYKLRPVTVPEPATVRRMFPWKRIAIAASIVGVLLVAGYWLFFDQKSDSKDRPSASSGLADVKAPETNRAMITLADGRQIYLDSLENGMIATQQNVVVSKTADGKITYEKDARLASAAAVYNTLTNPRGSKVIDMTLSDGSRVWLNAGSSVTYPVAFVSNERKVSITGEAYFEISHDAVKPFKVGKGEMEVTVLGTHFNVNAYDDEEDIKVTLLEGSVRVASSQAPRNDAILKPGQQAQVRGDIKVSSDVDTEQVMAWKNGIFYFDNTGIETIMHQAARWYDVDVVYEGNVRNEFFGGTVPRSENISQLIKALELTNTVKISVEEKKIIVRPAK